MPRLSALYAHARKREAGWPHLTCPQTHAFSFVVNPPPTVGTDSPPGKEVQRMLSMGITGGNDEKAADEESAVMQVDHTEAEVALFHKLS